MNDGSLEMKDSLGPLATGAGLTIVTVSPAMILQAIGILIAGLGVYYTRIRVNESKRANEESKRANDLYESYIELEKIKHGRTAKSMREEEKSPNYKTEET